MSDVLKAEPGWGTDPAENKLFFPPSSSRRISVQLDPFPDPLHLAAAQMLVLAAGGGSAGWECMAGAQRSQLVLWVLAAAEHKAAARMCLGLFHNEEELREFLLSQRITCIFQLGAQSTP